MKYSVKIRLGVVIKTGSAIQKLKEGYTDIQTAWRPHKPTLILLRIRKQSKSWN
jgi:hypothetical protein